VLSGKRCSRLVVHHEMGDEQLARNRVVIRERGAAAGFDFGDRVRVWNAFDAHRLLHWAGLQSGDAQRALKMVWTPPTPGFAAGALTAGDGARQEGLGPRSQRHRVPKWSCVEQPLETEAPK
jgi:hypothetical protein